MSMNLHLYDPVSGCNCHLYQTPTEDTDRILEAGTNEGVLQGYLQWMKQEWKGDKHMREEIKAHEIKIRKFLSGHPNAKFGRI
jgi:hypothetical protein